MPSDMYEWIVAIIMLALVLERVVWRIQDRKKFDRVRELEDRVGPPPPGYIPPSLLAGGDD